MAMAGFSGNSRAKPGPAANGRYSKSHDVNGPDLLRLDRRRTR